jgi:hypothetical protein
MHATVIEQTFVNPYLWNLALSLCSTIHFQAILSPILKFVGAGRLEL